MRIANKNKWSGEIPVGRGWAIKTNTLKVGFQSLFFVTSNPRLATSWNSHLNDSSWFQKIEFIF